VVNAYNWFKTIAAALNDDGVNGAFKRYALRDMVEAFNAGMCMVAGYRPDLFMDFEVIELVPGAYQDGRCACYNVVDVVAQVDSHGNVYRYLHGAKETTSTVKRNWNKPSCLTRDLGAHIGYVISYVNLIDGMNSRFQVEPPVPADCTYYVMVKCVRKPCGITEDTLLDGTATLDTDCTHVAALWHYVLARMLAGDRFSNGAQDRSKAEYSLFFQLLGIVEKQEDKSEKL